MGGYLHNPDDPDIPALFLALGLCWLLFIRKLDRCFTALFGNSVDCLFLVDAANLYPWPSFNLCFGFHGVFLVGCVLFFAANFYPRPSFYLCFSFHGVFLIGCV